MAKKSNLDYALEYADIGLKIFPLPPKSKRPHKGFGWKEQATNDKDWIKAWWTENPDDGIACLTGVENGLFVLDIDAKPTSNQALIHKQQSTGFSWSFIYKENLIETQGAWNESVKVQSGGGGLHFYFKLPKDVDITNQTRVFEGVDIKGNGGYIILPPSHHDKIKNGVYRWQDNIIPSHALKNLPEAPEWLYTAKSSTSGSNTKLTPESGRNSALADIAIYLRMKKGLDSDLIERVLTVINEDLFSSDPLPDKEVQTIASGMNRYDAKAWETQENYARKLLFHEDTDRGAAQRVADYTSGSLKIFQDESSDRNCSAVNWNQDTNRWELIGYNQVIKIIAESSDTIFDILERYKQGWPELGELDSEFVSFLHSKKRQYKSVSYWKKVFQAMLVNDDFRTERDLWDTNPDILVCPNGIVDLKTGDLRPATPDDLNLMCTHTAYDPDSKSKAWEQFLNDVFDGDQTVIQFVQTLLGYALTGRTDAHAFAFFIGFGSNGKSTLVEVVKRILGSYAISADFATFAAANRKGNEQGADLIQLDGPRLAIVAEPNKNQQFDASRLKSLTGEDTISARAPYAKEPRNFKSKCTPIFASNHEPASGDQSDGFWRRMYPVHFPVQFKSKSDLHAGEKYNGRIKVKQAHMMETLEKESVGILSWLVEGAKRYLAQGELIRPEKLKDYAAKYRGSYDEFNRFVEESLEIEKGQVVALRDLRNKYESWLSDHKKARVYRLSDNELEAQLLNLDYVVEDGNVLDVKIKTLAKPFVLKKSTLKKDEKGLTT